LPKENHRSILPIAHTRTHERIGELMTKFRRGRVLDCAAGEGAMALRLQSMGYEVIACDVEREKFAASGVRFCLTDLCQGLPFADATFDYVTCLESIEHLEDQFQFLRECARILRPRGKLVLSTPNVAGLASRLKFLLTGFFSLVGEPLNEFHTLPYHGHVSPLPFFLLRYSLHRTGFRITYVGTDFYRRSSIGLIWLYPLLRWFSLTTMSKEPDPRQRVANKEIRSQYNSLALLLGRTQIIVAEKSHSRNVPSA